MGIAEEEEEEVEWGEDEIRMRLKECHARYLSLLENDWGGGRGGDGEVDEEVLVLRAWRCPRVRVVELEDLVGECWVPGSSS